MRRAATVRKRGNRAPIRNCRLQIEALKRVQGSGFRVQHSAIIIVHPYAVFCNLQFEIFNFQFAIFIVDMVAVVIIFCLTASARGQVELPEPNRSDSIAVSAEAANRWKSGSYDVWLLRGNCRIQQGAADARMPRGSALDRTGRGRSKARKQDHRLSGRRRGVVAKWSCRAR